MEWFTAASYASRLGILICLAPLIASLWFAIRPAERLLSLLRPLSLMGIFSALCSFALCLLNGARALSRVQASDGEAVRLAALVTAEGLAPVVASLALLTVTWACVALGMSRRP